MSSNRKPKKIRIEQIPANQLLIDRTYQRDRIQARVTAIAESLDPDALGVFTVSRRSNGKLYIIDAQHRHAALEERGMLDHKVTCRVYEGLSQSEEAELYRQLNDTRPLKAWDFYKAGIISGDETCVEIDNVAQACGLAVAGFAGDGKICCVTTLRQVYEQHGKDVLEKAINIAIEAWGRTAAAVEKEVIRGLSVIAAQYNGELDMPWLIKKLSKYPGGPSGLLGRARGLRDLHTAPLYKLLAQQVIAIYNKGRRSGAVEDLI